MRYVMFICGDGTEPEVDLKAETEAWVAEMDGRGVRKTGDRLRPVADTTTVRMRGGEPLVTDGPFAEGTEVIGGFDLLDCADLDEALEVAGKHPVGRVRRHRAATGLGVAGGVTDSVDEAVEEAVAAAFRDEWGQVLATVIGLTGDWELAEDCVPDAFAAALPPGAATASRVGPEPG